MDLVDMNLSGIPSFLKRINMDVAVSRGFEVLAFNGSSSALRRSLYKTSISLTKTGWAAKGHSSSRLRTFAQAQERPTWLPGLEPPPYLDGTLAGDFGFDTLGLGEDPKNLKWFVETKRYMDFLSPGSQAKEGSFFGLEAALEGLEPGTAGHGSNARHFCPSFRDPCWTYRESAGTPFKSVA